MPSFDDAPTFDLGESLRSSGNGGGSGGAGGAGGGSLFEDQNQDRPATTKQERGEALAKLIRESIEPTIWAEAGGESSIRYFNGRLVVNAPKYVHRQIGIPVSAP